MQILNKQDITIDFFKPSMIPVYRFKQHDHNAIIFTIKENGMSADLSNINRIVVNVKRPDDEVISRELTKVNNTITYELGNSEMTVPGKIKMVMQFYDDQAERISTAKLDVEIVENIEPNMEWTEENATLYQQIITEIESLKNDFEVINAESKKQSDYAKTQGDYAKTQGEFANEKGLLADEKATLAQTATTNANLAIDKVNEAIDRTNNTIDTANEVVTNANDTIGKMETLLDSSVFLGDYSDSTSYVPNNLVRYNNAIYRCLINSNNINPDNTTHWVKYLSIKEIIDLANQKINELKDNNAQADSLIDNLSNTIQNAETKISETETARQNAISSSTIANDAANLATEKATLADTATINANKKITELDDKLNIADSKINDVETATNDANEATLNVTNSIANFEHLDEYSSDKSYKAKNIVSYNGSSYMCVLDCINIPPTNATNWKLLSSKGDQGEIGNAGKDGISFIYRENFVNNTEYHVNDVVTYNGSSYIAIKDNTNVLPTDEVYWNLMVSKGHVQLSSAIDSEDETLAATPKAVKTAYDRAEQAFQSASNGKKAIATAITGKGVATSATDTFATMATNISNIKTGYGVGDFIPSSKIGFCAEEAWKFKGHASIINSVAVDKNGNGNVYSGSADKTVRKLNSSGTEVWSFTGHTDWIKCTTVDDYGNVYSSSNDKTVRKLNSSGTEVWKFTGHTSTANSVAVDKNGNVYSGSSDRTIRKLNSSGTEVWKFTGHTSYVRGVAVDSDGNVYSCSDDNTVRKISSSGGQVWSFSGHTNYVRGVAVDSDGNVYSGSQDKTVRKINSSGGQVWSFSGHTHNVLGVAVDNYGNVYSGSQDKTVRKINSSGTEVWKFTGHTGIVYGIAVDDSGNVYSASSDFTVRKITEGYKVIT